MATVLKLGPADHGRPMSYDDFMAGDYALGYKYEIIDGKLHVSPLPNLPENRVEEWLYFKIKLFAKDHPGVINYATNKARVFVHARPEATVPEPDVAAFRDFPPDRPIRGVHWEEVSPILVAEVMSSENVHKDLVRNVELYLQVPSIKEYWLIDAREDPDQPTLTVRRRYGGKWRTSEVAAGETYATRLLPGFELLLDPHQ
jgi:Uma2 family endonuclease